jgi:hypothetical protein
VVAQQAQVAVFKPYYCLIIIIIVVIIMIMKEEKDRKGKSIGQIVD